MVQLYVHNAAASVARPVQELKGFRKIALKPGEKKSVSIPLGTAAFSFYDPTAHAWRAEPGTFAITIGSSSRDLRLKENFELTALSGKN